MNRSERHNRQRTNRAQQTLMLDFMSSHRDLATGKYSSENKKIIACSEWKKLSRQLNTLGQVKTVAQWQKVWTDMKSKVKKVVDQHRQRTGNMTELPKLSTAYKKVLALLNEQSFHKNNKWLPPEPIDDQIMDGKIQTALNSDDSGNPFPDTTDCIRPEPLEQDCELNISSDIKNHHEPDVKNIPQMEQYQDINDDEEDDLPLAANNLSQRLFNNQRTNQSHSQDSIQNGFLEIANKQVDIIRRQMEQQSRFLEVLLRQEARRLALDKAKLEEEKKRRESKERRHKSMMEVINKIAGFLSTNEVE